MAADRSAQSPAAPSRGTLLSRKRRIARRRLARRASLTIVGGVLVAVVLILIIKAVTTSSAARILSAPGVAPSGVGSPRGPREGPWHLRFDDEFNGQQLNAGLWQPNWLGESNSAITNDVAGPYELSCFDPGQVAVSGGLLSLTALHKPCTTESGATYQYDSGLVNTLAHYTFTYGFFEAKIWVQTSTCGSGDLPKAHGTCVSDFPTFWTTESNGSSEIDVMEGLQGLACFHFHDNDPTVKDPDFDRCPTIRQPGGWHVYAADWEPGHVTFYYDGKNVGSITNSLVPDKPMYLILSLGVPARWTSQTPVSLKVAYVRVWQH